MPVEFLRRPHRIRRHLPPIISRAFAFDVRGQISYNQCHIVEINAILCTEIFLSPSDSLFYCSSRSHYFIIKKIT